jgi:hypothetical protein
VTVTYEVAANASTGKTRLTGTGSAGGTTDATVTTVEITSGTNDSDGTDDGTDDGGSGDDGDGTDDGADGGDGGDETGTSGPVGLDVQAPTTATPDGEFDINYTVTNTGSTETPSAGLRIDLPPELSVATVSGDGTNEPDRFYLQPIGPNGSVRTTYTYNVTNASAGDSVTIATRAEFDSGAAATVNTTIDVRRQPTEFPAAGDIDGDDTIEFGEVLEVIGAFNENRRVNGQSPDFSQVLDVVAAFNAGGSV